MLNAANLYLRISKHGDRLPDSGFAIKANGERLPGATTAFQGFLLFETQPAMYEVVAQGKVYRFPMLPDMNDCIVDVDLAALADNESQMEELRPEWLEKNDISISTSQIKRRKAEDIYLVTGQNRVVQVRQLPASDYGSSADIFAILCLMFDNQIEPRHFYAAQAIRQRPYNSIRSMSDYTVINDDSIKGSTKKHKYLYLSARDGLQRLIPGTDYHLIKGRDRMEYTPFGTFAVINVDESVDLSEFQIAVKNIKPLNVVIEKDLSYVVDLDIRDDHTRDLKMPSRLASIGHGAAKVYHNANDGASDAETWLLYQNEKYQMVLFSENIDDGMADQLTCLYTMDKNIDDWLLVDAYDIITRGGVLNSQEFRKPQKMHSNVPNYHHFKVLSVDSDLKVDFDVKPYDKPGAHVDMLLHFIAEENPERLDYINQSPEILVWRNKEQ
ncbi:MAG: hypothetical protein PHV91_01245 [Bacteroidales bacterium]|jgi:hypothetical protein|nr:hypothetical protein [Candidatus Cloacimonadota bacterium]MCB5269257.1 hypothetical protein [Candidatus Cloacimonadota bacterium]MDD3299445.1 hypothetical protein [Bacteroidales bacterium]